ncbi:hypothetical protein [Haloferula sargassicola]|uniref:Protein BatD n=1 Tax=Haloferula sargassicola TaxID=490096 RepID=A0ABP9UNT1_9BACT
MRYAILALAALILLGSPLAAAGPPPGDIDLNRLRQLLQGGQEKKKTPEEMRTEMLQQIQFDRSAAGILQARLMESREKASEGEPPKLEGEEMIKAEVSKLARDVTLSRWEQVRDYLAGLPDDAGQQAYQAILSKLSQPVSVNPSKELQASGAKPYTQQPFLPPADFLGLLAAAPKEPDTKTLTLLAKVFPRSPRPPESFFQAIAAGVPHLGGDDPKNRLRAAELYLEAGLTEEAGPFLPTIDAAREDSNHHALNLIARHRAEMWRKDREKAGDDALKTAWEISTSFLSDDKAPPPERAEALFRALSLIPELEGKAGEDWLAATFGGSSTEGLEILATLGTLTDQSRENPDAGERLNLLKLQHDSVATLLAAPGVDAEKWSPILTLFARQWVHEADVTQNKDQSDSRRMVPQYDDWGNVFFTRPAATYRGEGTRPIAAASMIEVGPDAAWLSHVEPTVRIDALQRAARLFLKVKEEQNAIPLVAELAATHRDLAIELVRETIRVWSQNHNPNDEQDYRSRYFYYYGYNNQAESIPLTRSKQERNLVELAGLVEKIRGLDLDEDFSVPLAEAFISSHSQAEVWRVEAIESVFGKSDQLDAPVTAALVERMRLNLCKLWPDPKLQQAYKTQRKDKELQEQIFHGYAAAIGLVEKALARRPKDPWRLEVQLAALRYEESNYRSSIQPKNDHVRIVRESLDQLAAAADDYLSTLPRPENEETTSVFETWFYAALGSTSLESLKAHHPNQPGEVPKIKAALAKLPEASRERHLKAFATTLNNRLANVSPDLKLRYLEAAAPIVGEEESFRDAADVLAYYRDLVTEIELSATLDGPDTVSASSPFGLKVNLRHTREIEREAGGFQRYLQNQTGAQYAYNFGRPPEDYRDKFEKAAVAALSETFDVISVTFHSDKVESRTDPEFGWRLTPYAYLLLQPKGPQIDRIPPLSIDLDFQDTSGYVVLPITSAEIPIDASGKAAPRPVRNLRLTENLDARSESEKGSLFLEVRASGEGLVPELDELVSLPVKGFETTAIEDRKLQVNELDANADDLAPLTEHEWRLELKPAGGAMPARFTFPEPKVDLAAEDGLTRQIYDDVDLLPVEAEVPLGVTGRRVWPWVFALALFAALAAAVLYYFRRKKPAVEVVPAVPLPSRLTPVTLLGWLERLKEQPGLSPELRESLEVEILGLEARHFGPAAGRPDAEPLEAIARRWQAA